MTAQCGCSSKKLQKWIISPRGLGLEKILEWVATRITALRTCGAIPKRESPLTTLSSHLRHMPWSGVSARNAWTRMFTSGRITEGSSGPQGRSCGSGPHRARYRRTPGKSAMARVRDAEDYRTSREQPSGLLQSTMSGFGLSPLPSF